MTFVDYINTPMTYFDEIFEVQNVETSHVTLTTPLSWTIYLGRLGLAMINLCTKCEVSTYTCY